MYLVRTLPCFVTASESGNTFSRKILNQDWRVKNAPYQDCLATVWLSLNLFVLCIKNNTRAIETQDILYIFPCLQGVWVYEYHVFQKSSPLTSTHFFGNFFTIFTIINLIVIHPCHCSRQINIFLTYTHQYVLASQDQ